MNRRIASLLSITLLVTAALPVPGAIAAADGGLCRLLTATEVRAALGEGDWRIADDGDVRDQCYMHNGRMDQQSRAFSMRLLGSNESNQRDFRDDLLASGATELTVAGLPAVQDGRDAVTVFFPDPWDMLQLSPVGFDDEDVATGTRALAELAAGRYAAETGASPVGTAPAASPGAAASGDLCALLAAEEVTAALGAPVTLEALPPSGCLYHGGTTGPSAVGLTLAMAQGADADAGIEQLRSMGWPEITVGGLPTLQAPTEEVMGGLSRSVVAIIVGPSSVLLLSADAPASVDIAAAVLGLAELAVGRLGSMPMSSAQPAPSTAPASTAPSQPAASAEARTGLAALFPAEVGGRPTHIERQFTGRQFLSEIVNHEPMEERVTRALRRRDRRVRDLSFVVGNTASGSIIAAFQVEGGAIRPLVNVLLESLAMERTGDDVPPASVAGKEAFGILGGFLIGGEGVAYPKDDILWLVFSFGDEQTEIFEQLP